MRIKPKVFLFTPQMPTTANQIRRLSENLPLLALGSFLESQGYCVECYDMMCEGYENVRETAVGGVPTLIYGSTDEQLFERIDAFGPDVIGLSASFSFQDGIAVSLCNALKERYPDKILIAGGYAVMAGTQKYIESRIDYLFLGEGEFRLKRFLDAMWEAAPARPVEGIDEIDGLVYRKSDGEVVTNPPSSYIEDFDELPIMNRSLLNQEKYFQIGKPQGAFCRGRRPTTLFVGKGCPMRCTFCCYIGIAKHMVRYRSVDSIVQEIEYLIKEYGVDEIQFFCENLTFDKKFATELFQRLVPLDICWCTPVGLYFNSIDEEMVDLMAKSGAYQITLAVESASKRVLRDLMHKNVDIERVKSVVDRAHSHYMLVHGFFMIGMPGETKQEIQATLRFPFEAGFDSISISVVKALYPSELYDYCAERNYLNEFSVEAAECTNISIPKDSPDFSYEPAELNRLAKDALARHYEWSKERFPELWKLKYGKYIEKHPEDAHLLSGRIL
jgi:radical SAM superfamily enzyme YgiQ (UPF0313 family)